MGVDMSATGLWIGLLGFALIVAVLWINAWWEDNHPSRTAMSSRRDNESVREHSKYLAELRRMNEW